MINYTLYLTWQIALLFFRMNMYFKHLLLSSFKYSIQLISSQLFVWYMEHFKQTEEFNITTGLRLNNKCDWITSSLSHNTSHLFYLFDPDFHAGLYLFCGLCAVCCCHVVWWAFQHPQVKCVTLFKGNLEASETLVYFCCRVKYLLCLWTCLCVFTQEEAVVKTGCLQSF